MESEKPFTRDQLRGLDAGRQAVVHLVLQALIETHPKPQELLQAFSSKSDAAKRLMHDLRMLHPNPLEQRNYPPAFQELINDDLAHWLSLLERKAAVQNPGKAD